MLFSKTIWTVLRFSLKPVVSKFIKNRQAFLELKHEDWGRQDYSNPRD
jgi:hypothetical protein